MNDRDALIAAIAVHPKEDTPRLALADWLDENSESGRGEFIRLQCEAARMRPGTTQRADALRAADDLRAEHEVDWLGEWASRLVTWEYRRGFIWKVRMTADDFLAHGEELFRTEPVRRLEVVKVPTGWTCDHGDPLEADAIRAVVAHPAFGKVRECAVVTGYGNKDVDTWLASLAHATHATRLQSFVPCDDFDLFNEFSDRFGLDDGALAAFCTAPHLKNIRTLDLGSCPLRDVPNKDGLVERIATAPFAHNLRRLNLSQCRLTGAGLGHLASDPVFARLRSLNVAYNATDEPNAWAGLFHSSTLKALRSFRISERHLPAFADSPLAKQVRDLSVGGSDEGPTQRIRTAWAKLIATAPPPRRMELNCCNPGKAAFAAMRKARWLRKVRELAVRSDSQGGVEYGAGLRSLFCPKAMPRLTNLDLHESGDPALLKSLGAWPGLSQLESLNLADDYHGRLRPANFSPEHPMTCLRELRGVVISTDEEVERFLSLPGLENLTSLQLSFLGQYNRAAFNYTDPGALTEFAVDRLLRSEQLSRLIDLTLGFGYLRRLESHVVPQLADPDVLPRLQKLHLYVMRDGSSNDREPLTGAKERFGMRLIAW